LGNFVEFLIRNFGLDFMALIVRFLNFLSNYIWVFMRSERFAFICFFFFWLMCVFFCMVNKNIPFWVHHIDPQISLSRSLSLSKFPSLVSYANFNFFFSVSIKAIFLDGFLQLLYPLWK
jgi:hypothetical protein